MSIRAVARRGGPGGTGAEATRAARRAPERRRTEAARSRAAAQIQSIAPNPTGERRRRPDPGAAIQRRGGKRRSELGQAVRILTGGSKATGSRRRRGGARQPDSEATAREARRRRIRLVQGDGCTGRALGFQRRAPEEMAAAYMHTIDKGADFIESDILATKEG